MISITGDTALEIRQARAAELRAARAEAAAKRKENFEATKAKIGEKINNFRKWDRESTVALGATIAAAPEMAGIVGQAAGAKAQEVGTNIVQGVREGAPIVAEKALDAGKKVGTVVLLGVALPFVGLYRAGSEIGKAGYEAGVNTVKRVKELAQKTKEKAVDTYNGALDIAEAFAVDLEDAGDRVQAGVEKKAGEIRESFNKKREAVGNWFTARTQEATASLTRFGYDVQDAGTQISVGAESVKRELHNGLSSLLRKGAEGLRVAASKVEGAGRNEQERARSMERSRRAMEATLHSRS